MLVFLKLQGRNDLYLTACEFSLKVLLSYLGQFNIFPFLLVLMYPFSARWPVYLHQCFFPLQIIDSKGETFLVSFTCGSSVTTPHPFTLPATQSPGLQQRFSSVQRLPQRTESQWVSDSETSRLLSKVNDFKQ